MDRVQLLLVGLPLFLFASDIIGLFSPLHHQRSTSKPQPSASSSSSSSSSSSPIPVQHRYQPPQQHHNADPLQFPTTGTQETIGAAVGLGNTINIDFCASCSYKGTALTIKKMLETSFPGVDVVLANYPPPLPKRLLGKLVPVLQFGVMGVVIGGEHIFPRLGMAPPPWYYSLRANRFGTMATAWLLGNVAQSFFQSSGAFEVHFNGELIYSKLKEQRFPSEIELRDIVSRKLSGDARVVDELWS